MTFEKDVSFFHSFLFLDNLINGLYAFVDGGARSQKSHRSQFVYESGVGAVSMDNRKTLRLLFYGILPSPVHIFQWLLGDLSIGILYGIRLLFGLAAGGACPDATAYP